MGIQQPDSHQATASLPAIDLADALFGFRYMITLAKSPVCVPHMVKKLRTQPGLLLRHNLRLSSLINTAAPRVSQASAAFH